MSGQLGKTRKRLEEAAIIDDHEKTKMQLILWGIGCLVVVILVALLSGCLVAFT